MARLRLLSWRVPRRFLTWAVAVLATAVVVILYVALLAPRVSETLQPDSIQSDGDQGFVQGLSLTAPWPYVVPSHPDFGLTSRDALLSEDGRPIGLLEPSHAEIRRLGGGRFDFWQGTLWFSTSGFDPRGRNHSYVFSVDTRLNADLLRIWYWCGMALLALGAVEVGRVAVAASKSIAWSETWLWRASLHLGVRWRFRLPFLTVTFGTLAGLAVLALRLPLRVIYVPDTYAYIEPGLRLADGLSIAGRSARDLGYPLLTFLAVRFGSIVDLAPIQLGLVLLAIACMLLVMEVFCRAILRVAGFAAGRVPVTFTAGLIIVGVLYVLMLFSHNTFVLNMSTLIAEAPHQLPMAVALLCFVGGWLAHTGKVRIVLMGLATCAAFLSTQVKPSSLIAFALCATCLVVVCLLHWRCLRSPAVIGALLSTAVFVVGINRLDAWATLPGDDFGPKVLFCNHLDVIDGHLDRTTSERALIKDKIAHVFSLGPESWPLQGFNGDECSFVQSFTDAIAAAARSEGRTPKDWQMHEFTMAVLAHPLRYARHVGKQFLHFALYPIQEIDQETAGSMPNDDWAGLTAYSGMRTQQQSQFNVSMAPWFREFAPDLVLVMKTVLKFASSTFMAVALLSTLFALRTIWKVRRWQSLGPEVTLLSVAAFTTALPVSVALSHSFDVGRYTVDIMPFTLLWWWIGLIYLLRTAFRIGAAL